MGATLDRGPIYWLLCVVALLLVAWAAAEFFGAQRLHNTAVWQHWRPVMQKSAPQTVAAIEAPPGLAQTVVQTERGVYFLTGSRYRPTAGEQVIAIANSAWELYLCTPAGERCMSIHSFCAETAWAGIRRDAAGKAENCYAPRLAQGSNAAVRAITAPPPKRSGAQGGRLRTEPALGMAHPREWATKMGLIAP